MKLLFDLFPVILFFVTYKLAGGGDKGGACTTSADLPITSDPILAATAVAIAATLFQVGWLLMRKKKVDPLLWVSLGIVALFGGATLYLRDPAFIQWKPSILYFSTAVAFLAAPPLFKTNLVRKMMEPQIPLPDSLWGRLNVAWATFFVFMGGANLVAVHYLSCNDWVNFKLYGLTGLMFVFVIAQGLLLAKYMPEESK